MRLRSRQPLLGALLAVLLAGAAAGEEAAAEGGKPGLLELTAESFEPTLRSLPEDRWVLMEFYAHWCPHCQHFAPEYEKAAAFFGARGEQEPVVKVARLDCANFVSPGRAFAPPPSVSAGRPAAAAAQAPPWCIHPSAVPAAASLSSCMFKSTSLCAPSPPLPPRRATCAASSRCRATPPCASAWPPTSRQRAWTN